MAERNLDFDTIINRRNSYSVKYDFAKEHHMPENVVPMWVADMDFRMSSYIQDALYRQAQHGILGYSEADDSYYDAVCSWMYQHHQWNVKREWLVKTPGIVFALALAVKAFTKEGDAVLIQQPVYYPFYDVIANNGRRVVSNTLIQDETGKYCMDVEDFETKIRNEKIRLFILCSPHNPVGRVWSREELLRIGDICYRYGVIVISDEIHEDFVWRGRHHVLVGLKDEYREIVITATSPGKTFNIPGLQVSNIVIANPELKRRFQNELKASGYNNLNALGLIAAKAAYEHGNEWYESMYRYVQSNIEYTEQFVRNRLPDVKIQDTEGTYLAWLDFRKWSLGEKELENLIIQKAGLWLDSGKIFGPSGNGFQRLNTACPRKILEQALMRIEQVV